MKTAKVNIIAEIGVNHNGSLELAKKLIDHAVRSNVDYVKFQAFKAEELTTPGAGLAAYQQKKIKNAGSQYRMLKKLELSETALADLFEYASRKKIGWLSTPFDEPSARFLLEKLKMKIIKISSGEITNLPFLRFLARYRRPVILSTGMSTLNEVRQAVAVLKGTLKNEDITLLHCTSTYPCAVEDVHLRAMDTLREVFRLKVGYSDHTIGWEVAVAAVARGARVIEKHITLDPAMAGPDHSASLPVSQLQNFVRSIRNTERALGYADKKPTFGELAIQRIARKSLVLRNALKAGSVIQKSNLCAKRPGTGISPACFNELAGSKLRINKKADQTLQWKDVAR